MIYGVITMSVLMALGSLAVDWGRVQLAKTEMQRAVDSAARAASVYLPSDTDGARSAAISIAAANLVDGQPLTLLTGDIVFGKWNNQTGVFDTSSSTPDAVRITAHRTAARGSAIPMALAVVLGIRSQDLIVTQTTQYVSSGVTGIIGLNSIHADKDLFVASYNSGTTTNPSHSSRLSNGYLGSNGSIDGNHGHEGEVYGTVVLGPSGSLTDVNVHGSTLYNSSPIAAPTSPIWSPQANPGGISQNYTVSSNTTLAGGTYYFTSLTINDSKRLSFSGTATIYVNGNVSMDDDAALTAYNSIPGNLKIYQIGNRTFGSSGAKNLEITADIEAPSSDFRADKNLEFMGRLIAKTIDVDKDADFYYDEALGTTVGGSSGVVTTVK